MDKTKFVLIVVASMAAGAAGALLVSQQLRACGSPKDPIEEAQDMIGQCYDKINEIQRKMRGTRPSSAPAAG